MKKVFLLTAALIVLIGASAPAATIAVGTEIGVDFGTALGSGTNYNVFSGAGTIGSGSVIDQSGVTVDGVSITLGEVSAANTKSDSTLFPDPEVTDDMVYAPVITLSISGLDPSLSYSWLSIYNRQYPGRVEEITLSGLVGGDQVLAVERTLTSFHWFENIQPTAAGTITASIDEILDPGQDNAGLSGLMLTAVPEPATLALLGLGGLLLRRRR